MNALRTNLYMTILKVWNTTGQVLEIMTLSIIMGRCLVVMNGSVSLVFALNVIMPLLVVSDILTLSYAISMR